MDEESRRDVQYEGCFRGPAGVNAWLGGSVGCLVGVAVGLLAAGSQNSPFAGVGLWILCTILCTVLFAVFFRMRKFNVLLRHDRLEIVTPRRVRAIAYDQIRLIDAGIRIDSFYGEQKQNIRVCIHAANERATTIHVNRAAAYSLVEELRQRCPRAGGIHFDGTDWMPRAPRFAAEAQRPFRKILVIRAASALALGGTWLVAIVVTTAFVVSDRGKGADGTHEWSQLAFVWMAAPFAVRTGLRAARTWVRYQQLARPGRST